jgi:ribosomal protein S18 acetylase RimI-like enzyme
VSVARLRFDQAGVREVKFERGAIDWANRRRDGGDAMGMLDYRPAVSSDAEACVELRGRTRENAIFASDLASLGITARTWGRSIETGQLPGWVCTLNGQIVAYCFGDKGSGEIVVLAVLPQYEGRGIGKALLSNVMEELRKFGHTRLFLGCSSDSAHRSYGFYRHLGWRPTGLFDDNEDEVLEFRWQQGATD